MSSRAISERVAIKVKELQLTHGGLGKLIGVPKATASHYIYGTRDIPYELLPTIGVALNVSVEWLLGLTENPRETLTPGYDWRQKIDKSLAEEGIEPSKRQGVLEIVRMWLEKS